MTYIFCSNCVHLSTCFSTFSRKLILSLGVSRVESVKQLSRKANTMVAEASFSSLRLAVFFFISILIAGAQSQSKLMLCFMCMPSQLLLVAKRYFSNFVDFQGIATKMIEFFNLFNNFFVVAKIERVLLNIWPKLRFRA